MQASLLQEIGLAIVAGTVLAYVARWLRQPLLLGYIVAGVLIGPIGFGWVRSDGDHNDIAQLSELGLAFLMFIVGLEIDVPKLVSTGRTAAIITITQVIGSGVLGALAALALGYQGLAAVYIGLGVAFTSTMITVKLLGDRSELDTLAGRLSLGISLMQDVCAVVVLAIQPNLGQLFGTADAAAGAVVAASGSGGGPWLAMGWAVLKGLGLTVGTILASRYVLPWIFRSVAMLPEVMLLSAITWCFVVCYVAIVLGFSSAMGALIAGVSIAAYPYSLDVIAKIRGLRDFFVTLFFVSLGMMLIVPTLKLVLVALGLSVLVVVTRLVTVWPMARVFKLGDRVGILSSLHTVPVSEFGLVVAMIAGPMGLHQVGQDIVSLVVLLMIITSMVGTYLINYSHPLAGWIVGRIEARQRAKAALAGAGADAAAPGAGVSGTAVSTSGGGGGAGDGSGNGDGHHEAEGHGAGHHGGGEPVMLVGCFRIGSSLIHELHASGRKFAVIDFNPHLRDTLVKMGVRCVYGDISHRDTLEHAGVAHAKVLIVAVSDDFLRGTSNAKLLADLRHMNPSARIIVVAESVRHAMELYNLGADYVLTPRVLAARETLRVIASLDDADGVFTRLRQEHVDHLHSRTEVLP